MTLPVLTVTQLNRLVKNYLEEAVGPVQVEGELSNVSKPSSGHVYFTLKDHNAQLRCVFFKNKHRADLVKQLADGQQVIATGKLSLYEARGDYQLLVEELTKAGLGALYQRFEALKNKLEQQGLFQAERKKPLPTFPKSIGILSSPTGAAMQDILSTLARRYPLATLSIYPCEVQGANAVPQLIKALQHANKHPCCDVLILARGGGSIEDLWAFNDEQLALQIAASKLPIITGIGHKTDFTIADFVADYNAETPTAAANAATPDIVEIYRRLEDIILLLINTIARKATTLRMQLNHATHTLNAPQSTISTYSQRLDYLENQLLGTFLSQLNTQNHVTHLLTTQLHSNNPTIRISHALIHLQQLTNQLTQLLEKTLDHRHYQLSTLLSTLHAVSPLATLDRGYALATKNKKIVDDSSTLKPGDLIAVRLAKGSLTCEVLTCHS